MFRIKDVVFPDGDILERNLKRGRKVGHTSQRMATLVEPLLAVTIGSAETGVMFFVKRITGLT